MHQLGAAVLSYFYGQQVKNRVVEGESDFKAEWSPVEVLTFHAEGTQSYPSSN